MKEKRTMFRDHGYEWVHRDGPVAILRTDQGGLEVWRVIQPGDVVADQTWSKNTPYTFVEAMASGAELPRWGRADLKVGQTVEIHARFNETWAAGDGYGTIESAYWVPGSRRYRVRLAASGTLRSFKAHDLGLIG